MRIPRLYLDPQTTGGAALRPGQSVQVEGDPAHYLLRVLRLKAGAKVVVFTGRGGQYHAHLGTCGKHSATLEIGPHDPIERESPLRIVLAQGISRGERMDYTLQKAVELGVSEVYPLYTRRCGVTLKGPRLEKRLEHWRSIVAGACAQSGRNTLPSIHPPQSLWSFLGQAFAAAPSVGVVLDPVADHTLGSLPPPTHNGVSLLVGPEGGLTPEELDAARRQGFVGVRLGPRVLRTETAPLAAITGMQLLWGDLV